MSQLEVLWCEKYRPKTLSEYIFHDDKQKQSFSRMVEYKSIPHLLLSGVAGSGKTSIARILINECQIDEVDVLTINASDENSVDVIRDKIKGFISTYAMGEFKIIHLSEADYITANGQAVLRVLMEEYADNARFILDCNYENKIIPAIKSRCQHFRFKTGNKNDITERIATILIQEKIKFDIDLLDTYVSVGFPDIRKIINLTQQNSINNTLQPLSLHVNQGEAGDYKFDLITYITRDNWKGVRDLVCGSVSGEEWEEVYRFVYENIHKSAKFKEPQKWEEAIITIAEYLYKHALCADPNINFTACAIRLGQL